MEATLAEKFALYFVMIGSLSVHEFAHAWAADKLGDHTPRSQGRVTLNPLAHIDLLGTVLIPIVFILFSPGFALLGWGRPVIINPKNFKRPILGDCLSTAAGPLSNLVLALLVAVLFGLWIAFSGATGALGKIVTLGGMVIYLNVLLAVFNLIPIPPLDGSHFLRYIVGMGEEAYIRFAQWGTLILILLINFDPFMIFFQTVVAFCSAPFVMLMSQIASILAGAPAAGL